jgi:hypothetical protein
MLKKISIAGLILFLVTSICLAKVVKKTEHFIIDWQGGDNYKADYVAAINYEWYLFEVCNITGIDRKQIKGKPTYIYFYESRAEFEDVWINKYRGNSKITKRVMAFYSVDQDQLVFDCSYYRETVLVHEMAHYVLHHYFTQYMPDALDELIAYEVEERFLERQYARSLEEKK